METGIFSAGEEGGPEGAIGSPDTHPSSHSRRQPHTVRVTQQYGGKSILTKARQRRMDLHGQFQASQGYVVRPSLQVGQHGQLVVFSNSPDNGAFLQPDTS